MDLSIIIVNWNTKEYLQKCLGSIYAYAPQIAFEIWVVDNNSQDQSIEMLKNKFPQVKLIVNRQNVGFAKANNQAIRKSSGKYILLLNPDTVVSSDTLEKMWQVMETYPRAGLISCTILNPDGTVQAGWDYCKTLPSWVDLFLEIPLIGRPFLYFKASLAKYELPCAKSTGYLGVKVAYSADLPPPAVAGYAKTGADASAAKAGHPCGKTAGYPFSVVLRRMNSAKENKSNLNFLHDIKQAHRLSGSCLMIRRETLEQAGLLDERFFMYLEDIELCYQARRKGWKVYFLSNAFITHFGRVSARQVDANTYLEYWKSWCKFLNKHYGAIMMLMAKFVIPLNLIIKTASFSFLYLLPLGKDIKNTRRIKNHLAVLTKFLLYSLER